MHRAYKTMHTADIVICVAVWLESWLLFQRTRAQFPALTSGGSPQPVALALGNSIPLFWPLHVPAHMPPASAHMPPTPHTQTFPLLGVCLSPHSDPEQDESRRPNRHPRVQKSSRVQGEPQLHSKPKASLIYRTPSLKIQ